jgi:hypothetical protein
VRLDERRGGVPTSAAAVAARWFAQDLFEDPNLALGEEDDMEEGEGGPRAAAAGTPASAAGQPGAAVHGKLSFARQEAVRLPCEDLHRAHQHAVRVALGSAEKG